ncbi:MAG: class I SAM-dependent methyltransferase [Lachnospiraceae bacterium]|nr:class I SAM-dependent methyltransferase [Lachnospiraceae bacterium]
MDIYRDFAGVYDLFMEDTPYDAWTGRIHDTLKEYAIDDGLIADLGCGTGAITRRLSALGYDMIGIDASEDMLAVAKERDLQSGAEHDILYLCQDMTEFELYGTVRAIVSVCDCVNYLTDPDSLLHTFKLVNNYLDPGGIFIFDFNTTHKYRDVIGDTVIAENREDCSFIWENFYDEETHINEYDLTLFIKEGDLFRKSMETHAQRGYTSDEMRDLLERSGLKIVEFMDADTGKPVSDDSERVYVVAGENGK